MARQPLAFAGQGFEIAVETNGSVPAPSGIDWLCVSPKSSAPLAQTRGHELKLVYPQAKAMPERFDRHGVGFGRPLLDVPASSSCPVPPNVCVPERNVKNVLEPALASPEAHLLLAERAQVFEVAADTVLATPQQQHLHLQRFVDAFHANLRHHTNQFVTKTGGNMPVL